MADTHLVHGMGTGLTAPSWPPIRREEAEAILAMFPAAGVLERLEWHSPRPFSSATLARTSTGDVFLKRHHRRLRTPAQLADEHAFMAHLATRGRAVAQPMRTTAGATALAEGEWTWEVHRKAAGRDLYRDRHSWTPFLDLAHAHAAGAELARLHIAAEGFSAPARPRQPLVSSFTILPADDPLAAAEAYVAARPALAGFLAGKAWRADLARLFAALGAEELAPALSAQPPLWTHNDWHPSNLLWDEAGGVATIFDFGLADRTCALHDLATALERTAIRWLELDAGPDAAIAEPDAARALLAGYASVRPLGDEALALLTRLLPLVHVEFALSEADYFRGVLGRDADADLAWQGYLVGHAEWFLSPAGQSLLEAIGPDPAERRRRLP
ncbi:phosphotransferase enzyme family protein [Sphingomonas abietis]|uniref:Phosphotransferase n=1 Tax=Sphingomonas abietis TaxID=3012344 RepID=A0ABY7NLQ0_9SPHN|nr:phosphotransferase [Sphingomonas abietis]WBO22278.1 phosphotransferase [Sphingomonas abietis]